MGNNTLSLLAGTETWTETLAKQFKKMGHEVTAYSKQLGFIAMQLEGAGIHCIDSVQTASGMKAFDFRLTQPEGGNYDLIVCNHYEVSLELRQAFPDVPMIVTIHGIIHKGPNGEIFPEHPATSLKNVRFVAVGEEVQELLRNDYALESTIIRNFLDLERFKVVEGTDIRREKPEIFLVNSNYWTVDDPINEVIKEVADHYGAQLRCVGTGFGVQSYEMNELLADADVVFGMGRSVLEGMAMGKVAVSHGRFGTGGVLTPETYPKIRHFNFSGRNSGRQLAVPADLIAAIDAVYSSRDHFDWCIKTSREEHNVEKAAEAYLTLGETLKN